MGGKDFVRLVGRRAALRYALAGMAAATVAACSGNGSTSVRSQTLSAFLQGTWHFKNEEGEGARVDVLKDGRFRIAGGEPGTEWSGQGTWQFQGGLLSYKSEEDQAPYVVHEMPEQADKALHGTYTVSGGLIDNGGQEKGYSKMRVTGSKDKVVLTFPRQADGEPRVITCTRATSSKDAP
ncbi:hypothetical protein [Streptomyces sp. NPDC059009]|uniref:hypothetical protein n=1 Tax=Streptomyces sp. NPDC059009 TaxID=3346694 RepID=UPI00368A2092